MRVGFEPERATFGAGLLRLSMFVDGLIAYIPGASTPRAQPRRPATSYWRAASTQFEKCRRRRTEVMDDHRRRPSTINRPA